MKEPEISDLNDRAAEEADLLTEIVDDLRIVKLFKIILYFINKYIMINDS